jgi:hypothetical protein
MQLLLRSIATMGCLAWAALAATAHAQVIDPEFVGSWAGRSPAAQVTLSLGLKGALLGTVVSPGLDCGFNTLLRSRDIVTSNASRLVVNGSGSLVCLPRRQATPVAISIDATPGTLTLTVGNVTQTLTRNSLLLGSAGSGGIVSPDIPGGWQGSNADGVSVSLDLAVNGIFSGSVSGHGFDGCKLIGVIPPKEAFDNDPGEFSGFGPGGLVGCTDATRNGVFAVFLGATPQQLSVALLRLDNEDTVFSVEEMTRAPLLGANGVDARTAKMGMWNSPSASGWGLSLTVGKTSARIPFVVLYVYSGKAPTWYVMPSGTWSDDNNFSGDLYATTGTDWRAGTFDPASVAVKKVGTLSMTFTSSDAGRLTYDVKDSTGDNVISSPMAKQLF